MVQWLGKALPAQRVQLRFLVEELGDPMCLGAKKPKQNGSSVVAPAETWVGGGLLQG